LQYEVYDPGKRKESAPALPNGANGGPAQKPSGGAQMRVLTSLEFLQGDRKLYETKPLEATELTDPQRKAVIFQIELPLDAFPPGLYTCQINVVDDAAGSFAFPRTVLLIKSPQPAAPATTAGTN